MTKIGGATMPRTFKDTSYANSFEMVEGGEGGGIKILTRIESFENSSSNCMSRQLFGEWGRCMLNIDWLR